MALNRSTLNSAPAFTRMCTSMSNDLLKCGHIELVRSKADGPWPSPWTHIKMPWNYLKYTLSYHVASRAFNIVSLCSGLVSIVAQVAVAIIVSLGQLFRLSSSELTERRWKAAAVSGKILIANYCALYVPSVTLDSKADSLEMLRRVGSATKLNIDQELIAQTNKAKKPIFPRVQEGAISFS